MSTGIPHEGSTPRSPRGRGTGSNPANRFEPLTVDREEPGPEKVPTQLLADKTRSIIARNDSPDVGFETSVNPYRGCEHGCVYCVWGETPILMADGTPRALRELRVGDEIYGTRRDGWYRRYVRTRVLAHWETVKPAYEITLADGTRLVASGDHRFLTERGWRYVTNTERGRTDRAHLTVNNALMGTGRFSRATKPDPDYRRGYLAGMIRGDGHFGYGCAKGAATTPEPIAFRLALVDSEALHRAQEYLAEFGIQLEERVFQAAVGARQQVNCIRTGVRSSANRIRELVGWPLDPTSSWRRGFLAGIFDAEGSYSCGALRISNTDQELIDWTTSSILGLGLGYAMEQRAGTNRPVHVVRLTGGLTAHLRFFHTIGNAISRKRDIEGVAIKSNALLDVVSIEPVGEMPLFDITTGTGDFIADGVVSHNCFARPFHEYLGFSAGLDFETKILVKEQAPELLRRELMSPKWEPQLLVMSGVTDCYQPSERKLEITRRCLGVLAEFRNPVHVITKNHLVTRDVDHLGELASFGAASVTLSITSLDPEVARRMEPRASAPRERLAAVTRLREAGIPAGVNVAPVVPGITDHELPAILAAAKEAGASWATFMFVRLPHGVKDLFQDWLSEHYPDRKEKVLARIRALRGGKLNEGQFGKRFHAEGVFAEQLEQLFAATAKRLDLPRSGPELSTEAFRRPGQQLGLF
jgi:DNA repair photolyase